MKKLTKIWGIGLVVVMLVPLFGAALPVSAADPMVWNQEAVPDNAGYVLLPSSDVLDFSVGGDGTTIYAATGNTTVFKSVDGGKTWALIDLTLAGAFGGTAITPGNILKVAVAPDDNNYVAVSANNLHVYVSTNGGATWGDLGIPQDVLAGGSAAATITDIDMSSATGGSHYLAVSGTDAALGNMWYYALGIGGSWKQTNNKNGFATSWSTVSGNTTNVLAVKFSPNFSSDLTVTAVTANATFEMFNLSATSLRWNNAAFGIDTQYPILVKTLTDATGASIGLGPDFSSFDETTRNAFVGLTCTSAANAGIFRVENTTVTTIKSLVNFYSIAFDGTVLVAGETAAARVWRSEDAMDQSPTVFQNSALKGPSGATATVVAFAGTNVMAGTTGNESAFAISTNNGQAFNDISLIDTTIVDIEDLQVSPDSTKIYLLTNDAADTSVWYYAGALGWQRVLCLVASTGHIIRVAPDNFNVVYVAFKGSGNIYFNRDAGFSRWNTRQVSVTDMAVESADIAYVAFGSSVSKSTNGGSIWSIATPTGLGGIYSLALVGAGNIIAGGTDGYVAYSTDANATYKRISVQTATGVTNLQVVADKLTSGGFILAGSGTATGGVYRWQIGQSVTLGWKAVDASGATNKAVTVEAIVSGIFYSLSAKTSDNSSQFKRARSFSGPTVSFSTVAGPTSAVFNNAPTALRTSTTQTPGTKLWAAFAGLLYSWEDTLVTAVPTLVAPTNGALVKINPISGSSDSVVLSWNKITGVTNYTVTVYFDAAATSTAFSASTAGTNYAITTANLTLMPGDTYYWRVAVSSTGPVSSGNSELRSFTIQAAPAIAPTIGSPANGASITNTTPSFSWSPVGGTTTYTFQLATNPNFTTPLVTANLTTTAYVPATALTVGTTYYWRVMAALPIAGDWSTVANFAIVAPPTTTTAPPPVTVTQPAPTVVIPPITMPTPTVIIPSTTPAPSPTPISTGLLLTVIIIGAVLVIALIVLIVRTRRTV